MTRFRTRAAFAAMLDEDQNNYYRDFDEDDASVDTRASDYSPSELRKNRLWIIGLSMFALSWIFAYWMTGKFQFSSVVTLTGITLITARFFWWLFASRASAKIHGNSAGTGKTIERPRTLGGMIGYFLDL